MSQSICLIKEETVSTDAATAMLKKGIARHCWAVWNNFTTLTGIERKLLIKKSKFIPGKWKNLCICWGILITLKKSNTCKYVFLTYGSSQLLFYFTPVDSDWWNLRKLVTFASVKRNNLISLIIQIAQLLPAQPSSSTMLFSFRFAYFL